MKKLLVLAVALTSTTAVVQALAQAPPAFEVASVKRNKSGDGFMTVGFQPGGRQTLINVPARQLIVRAYGVQPYQVLGGPSWITSDRFDVTTKAAAGTSPQEQNVMLQALLADRFKLKAHKETRQSDVFRLVKARADGKLGDSIKPAAVICDIARAPGAAAAPIGPGIGGPVPVPPPGPRGGGQLPVPGPGGRLEGCQMMMAPGRFQIAGQSMATFVNSLAIQLGRPVIDDTGLAGAYDFTLSFMPDGGGRVMPVGPLPPGAPELPAVDPNAPALPTALQEQLGLKLDAGKGPVEMIVIDSIDQPTED